MDVGPKGSPKPGPKNICQEEGKSIAHPIRW